MTETEQFWAGEFGNQYHKRCRVDWRERIPFWQEVMNITGARSVFEFGAGPGWNLSAIQSVSNNVICSGLEINDNAVHQALAAGCLLATNGWLLAELTFTAGVLIHIAPEQLRETMQKLIDNSYDYVLAVEYAADVETDVEYRGHKGRLWKRPYGKLYQDMGLELVRKWDEIYKPVGFDNCDAWLLRKP